MGTAVTRPSSSLTEEVYQRLRNDLLACRIAPGERLRIADLCEQLGVSLGAVREALSRLTSEGLVLNEPQKGFRAAPISANELRDLTEVRVDIEGLCLQRAIAHGDVRWEGEILGALHQLARTPQYAPDDNRRMNDAWSTMHSQFHEALISACDSPVLMQIRRQLYDQSERYRRLTAPLGKRKRDLQGEHRALAEAVLAKDVAAAQALMAAHLRATTQILLMTLKDDKLNAS